MLKSCPENSYVDHLDEIELKKIFFPPYSKVDNLSTPNPVMYYPFLYSICKSNKGDTSQTYNCNNHVTPTEPDKTRKNSTVLNCYSVKHGM